MFNEITSYWYFILIHFLYLHQIHSKFYILQKHQKLYLKELTLTNLTISLKLSTEHLSTENCYSVIIYSKWLFIELCLSLIWNWLITTLEIYYHIPKGEFLQRTFFSFFIPNIPLRKTYTSKICQDFKIFGLRAHYCWKNGAIQKMFGPIVNLLV